MKVLLVNKFLFVVGGAESYMLNIGNKLKELGHEVKYFGLKNKKNIASNEFLPKDSKINPFSKIYSTNVKKQFQKLIDEFKPDIVHFNNINYQLTTSIIDACKENNIPAVMTLHDPQIVCPNHMFFSNGQICTECLDGNFHHCIEKKCIKNNLLLSYIGYKESLFTHKKYKYDWIYKFISPSSFLAKRIEDGGFKNDKIIILQNPSKNILVGTKSVNKQEYILYFGRLSEEKGIRQLLDALPHGINLKVAGSGPLEGFVKENKNCEYLGQLKFEELKDVIRKAKCTIYPSIWYENCPMSIIESISLGTPVLASNFGGIPELIKDGKTGYLFDPKDNDSIKRAINKLFTNNNYQELVNNCLNETFIKEEEYVEKLINIYLEAINDAKINK